EFKDGLPVVPMLEGSRVLRTLVLMCYPVLPPLKNLEDAAILLAAVSKYKIKVVQK
ncbi:hypothetical protein FIBSPDRAFT_677706, partial [Athelia psychrophila]